MPFLLATISCVRASLPDYRAPAGPTLAAEAGRVVVRVVDLVLDAGALARAEEVLSPAELGRARRGTTTVHRRRVALRAALRQALADELGLPPAQVPLVSSPTGQPRLAGDGPGRRLHVSCSADGDLGLVAVGRGRRVGVDVEHVVPWAAGVLEEGWLDACEQRELAALPPGARPLAAARAWTQKEAVLKACGSGLREHPVGIATVIGRRQGTVAGWPVHDVPVPEGRVASLAVGSREEVPA